MIARSHGSGNPRTVIVPGLGATAGEARVPASGLPGTRIVLTLPSHADAPDAAPGYWDYPTIAADIAPVLTGVRQAVGVSLGAGALSALVASTPSALDRLVLMLPAALTEPRQPDSASRVLELADAAEAGDRDLLRSLVAADTPVGLAAYVDERTTSLLRLGPALRAMATQVPVPPGSSVGAVTAEVLVVAGTGDRLHPTAAAEEAAAAFPNARLARFDSPAPLVTHRREIRALLTGFLT